MFKWFFLFLLISSAVLGQENSDTGSYRFISEVRLSPAQLRLDGDSIRFSIKGIIPNESLLMPRNPRLGIQLYSSSDTVDLGTIPMVRRVANFLFEKSFSVRFQPWMEGAKLELAFFQGSKDESVPFESRILARGVSAPQLLVTVGEGFPDEPFTPVGLFQMSGDVDSKLEKTEEFFLQFRPGSFQLESGRKNQEMFGRLTEFLEKNPDVLKVSITGLQSPEQSEGRNSLLGRRRAEGAAEALRSRFVGLDSSKITLDSRWNDWYDLRLFLEGYEGVAPEEKELIQQELLGEGDYLQKWERLKKMSGFDRVSTDLFPRLRTAKIEITSKPLIGLSLEQFNRLQRSLSGAGSNELSFEEWALAAEASRSLEEKGQIYSKMTEFYRSALPYTNMAVIRMRQAQRVGDPGSKEILWEEADRLLQIAIQIEPGNAYALHNQGQVLVMRGQYWEGYKKLSEASVLSKDQDFILANDLLRGALDILRGDYKLAILRFNHHLSDPRALFNKGLAYYLTGDFVRSALAFEESVIRGRELGYGYYGLALIAAQTGQDEIATIQLQKAIFHNKNLIEKMILEPGFQELRNNSAYLKDLKIN